MAIDTQVNKNVEFIKRWTYGTHATQNIVELFDVIARENKDKFAVVDCNKWLTYQSLSQKSVTLAYYLIQHHVRPNDIVGICIDRSPDFILSMLGILKSGAAYLPLDPLYPSDRLEYMALDSNVKIIITVQQSKEFVQSFLPKNVRLIVIDEEWRKIELVALSYLSDSKHIPISHAPDHLAYVIYTSGSTGKPKGVMVEHAALMNLIQWHIKEFKIQSSENVSLFSSFNFDASVWEIFPYIGNGNTIYLLSENERSNLSELNAYFHKNNIAIAFLPTAVAEQFMALENKSLRLLLTGGDKLTKRPQLTSKYRLVNNYGPTENTVVATSQYVGPSQKVLSIGKPIDGVEVYILDENHKMIAEGKTGELYIAGKSLARGYINNPNLTAEKFIHLQITPNTILRLYKTGDLVRKNKNGTIEFLGRIDHQIKLRGFRIELGEIEDIINKHNEVEDCVVVINETNALKQLIAYYVIKNTSPNLDSNAIAANLKKHIAKYLPSYMHPSHIIAIDKLPLTINGKKNRELLSQRPIIQSRSQQRNTVMSKLEKRILKIWQDIFNDKNISISDNVFDLGGQSILFMRAISKIEKEIGIRIGYRSIFDHPVIADIAGICEKSSKVNDNGIGNQIINGLIPLSATQERMWFLHKVDRATQYNVPLAIKVSGPLNFNKLYSALKTIVARHEILRTSIVESLGKAHQSINLINNVSDLIEYTDVSHNNNPMQFANDLMSIDAHTSFQLDSVTLFRAKLFVISKSSYILYFNFHHSIIDAWSITLFLKELSALYHHSSENILPPLLSQYRDYAIWSNKQLTPSNSHYIDGMAFWINKVKTANHLLTLTTDYQRPKVISGKGNKHLFEIDSETTYRLQAFIKSTESTMFVIFMAVTYLVLRTYSNQDSFCIGSTVSNRVHQETEDMIGCFINTVAVAITTQDQDSLRDLLSQIRKYSIDMQDYQDIPFQHVVDAVQPERDSNRTPIFQVMLNVLNVESAPLQLKNTTTENLYLPHHSSVFDLSVIVESVSDKILMSIQYSTDLFQHETIIRMQKHFINTLNQLLDSVNMLIKDIKLVSQFEYQQIIYGFNQTTTNYPRDKSITQIFQSITQKYSSRIALESDTEQVTYQELHDKSDCLATYLQSFVTDENKVIGLFLDRSANAVMVMLSILKAGGAYLPLDVDYPIERLAYMLDDAKIKIIVTSAKYQDRLKEITLNKIHLVNLDNDWGSINTATTYPRPLTKQHVNSAKQLAYVIYTSGSTGKPKGVMVEHRGVVRLVKNTNYIDITATDRFLQFSSLSFDAATFEIWGALLNGAKLVISSPGKQSLAELAKIIKEKQVSVIFLTSILFKLLAEQHSHDLATVRTMIAGGEAVDLNNAITKFLSYNQKSIFVHAYGPTENTTFTTCCPIKGKFDTECVKVPIGKPLANTQVYILDINLNPVPIGVPGYLFTTGDGIARGYLNNDNLTMAKFLKCPFHDESLMYDTGDIARWLPNGDIEFIGRNDGQVKIRGYRIELTEIENVLNRHTAIKDSIVIAKGENTEKILVAYYTRKNKSGQQINLKAYLQKLLPTYMIPNYFIEIENIPLTSNGKIDVKKLNEIEIIDAAKPVVGAQNDIQAKLIKIWQDVLNVKAISIYDNYFDLGGDSIKNILIVSRAQQNGLTIHVQDIFSYQTIYDLATNLEKCSAQSNSIEADQAVISGPLRLTPSQKHVIETNAQIINKSGIEMLFALKKDIHPETMKRAIKKIVIHHDMLRLRYHQSNLDLNAVISSVDTVKKFLTIIESDDATYKNHSFDIKSLAEEYRDYINPQNGSLFYVIWFRTMKNQDKLLIIMHHLISDAFSWRILVEDFDQLLHNIDNELLPKTTSYQYWSNKLHYASRDKVFDHEVKFWKSQLALAGKTKQFTKYHANHGHKEIVITISKHKTAQLKALCKQATKIALNEILIASLFLSFQQWTGQNTMSILLTTHGRHHPFTDVNVSRTIGLFTNIFPIAFTSTDHQVAIEKLLLTIKQTMNNIPSYGMSYGMFKYLSQSLCIENNKTPEIFFNYMGDFGQRDAQQVLKRLDGISDRNITMELKHNGLSIVGMEYENELTMIFGCSQAMIEGFTIEAFAESFANNLDTIINGSKDIGHNTIPDVIPSLFIPFKPKKANLPIIFIPGQGGSCMCFNTLTNKMSLPNAMYGIQAYGLNHNEKPFSSIEEMAYYNIQLLKYHFPIGPYILMGYSYGGTVAFEMAWQLMQKGESVSNLILLDAPPHEYLLINDYKRYVINIFYHLNHVLRLNYSVDERINDIQALIANHNGRDNIDALHFSIIQSVMEWSKAKFDKNMLAILLNMYRSQATASFAFTGKSVNHMTIILAKDMINQGSLTNMNKKMSRWQQHVKNKIDYRHVPGNHFSLLEEPYVGKVAETIQDVILGQP